MGIVEEVLAKFSIAPKGILANKFIEALLVLVGFFVISKIFVFISQKIILRLTKKTKTKVDDLIIERTNKPISFVLLILGLQFALIELEFSQQVNNIVNGIAASLIILCITFLVVLVLDIIIEHWAMKWAQKTKTKHDDQLVVLFHRFSKVVIFIIGLLFVLQSWGIQIGPLLASLGIAGIAIAFALQSTLGNIFGGISLIIDKSIKEGDIIRLSSGEVGEVYNIGIRSTKIKTPNNQMITVPNGKLADSVLQNDSMPDLLIRVDLEFGVEYGSDPDEVKKIALDIVKETKGISKKNDPDILFIDMGDFALKFKLMFWVDDISIRWKVRDEVLTKLYKSLNKAKIGIPFPARTVYLKK